MGLMFLDVHETLFKERQVPASHFSEAVKSRKCFDQYKEEDFHLQLPSLSVN
jgi:hypothetical protein